MVWCFMSNEIVHEWVQKAEEDYHVALTLDPGKFPNVICFHS